MVAKAVDERDVVETLDAVESLFDVRLAADAEMFELAAQLGWVDTGWRAHAVGGGTCGPGWGCVDAVDRGVLRGGVRCLDA
ncbi:MAG: hypothetical protein M3393_08075, partial [Actinomycetota bacterium]|nr:hypothetical protein [Actinomycetota bacterium]